MARVSDKQLKAALTILMRAVEDMHCEQYKNCPEFGLGQVQDDYREAANALDIVADYIDLDLTARDEKHIEDVIYGRR